MIVCKKMTRYIKKNTEIKKDKLILKTNYHANQLKWD